VSIWLLKLDPLRVDLRATLANDEIMGTETVADTAVRHRALAAVNGGFFLPNGDPAGVLTVDGRLVSDTRRPRGAVGIVKDAGGVKLPSPAPCHRDVVDRRRLKERHASVDGIDDAHPRSADAVHAVGSRGHRHGFRRAGMGRRSPAAASGQRTTPRGKTKIPRSGSCYRSAARQRRKSCRA
jgi:hypothetical protein